MSTKIRDRFRDKRSLTADVAYEDCRRFPEGRGPTIGPKDQREFWNVDRAIPGPDYLPGTTLEHGLRSIGEKRYDRPAGETPGPGEYNPANPAESRPSRFTCKGAGARDDWLPKRTGDPGPGEYNVRRANDRPKWTIGDRSVSRTARSTCPGQETRRGRRSASSTGRQSR
jgi:hypothetical protein